jgi:WD40 repeat protein
MPVVEPRPGFNLEQTFKAHLSPIRALCYHPGSKSFFSADDKSLKTWTPGPNGTCRMLNDVAFPGYQVTMHATWALCMLLGMGLAWPAPGMPADSSEHTPRHTHTQAAAV